MTDAIPIPAGNHQVDIRPTGAAAGSAPILSQPLVLEAGQQLSAVVHLDPQGRPRISVFPNEPDGPVAGQARVIVRNVGETPVIDALVDEVPVALRIGYGSQGTAALEPGDRTLGVRASDGPSALPSRPFTAQPGTDWYVYVVGAVQSNNVSLLAHSVVAVPPAPLRISTGADGLAADPAFPAHAALVALMALGGALVLLRGGRAGRPGC